MHMSTSPSDYITIADSLVYSNTWWTSSAESAVVLAESVSVDDDEGIKMRLVNNTVYDNVNKVRLFLAAKKGRQSDVGAAVFPTSCCARCTGLLLSVALSTHDTTLDLDTLRTTHRFPEPVYRHRVEPKPFCRVGSVYCIILLA